MAPEDRIREILEDNRRARDASSARITRLVEVIRDSTPQEFSETVNGIFREINGSKSDDAENDRGESDPILGSDGPA